MEPTPPTKPEKHMMQTGEKRRKQTRLTGEQRRKQIMDTAIELFAEKGYENTTTKEISQIIGTSEVLIFKHFPSKDALYQALFEVWAEEQKNVVRIDILESSALKTLRYIAENIENIEWLHAEGGRNYRLDRAVKNRYDTVRMRIKAVEEGSDFITESLLPIFEFGQENGEICDEDPVALATMFYLTFVGGILQSHRFSNFQQPPIDLFIKMIKK